VGHCWNEYIAPKRQWRRICMNCLNPLNSTAELAHSVDAPMTDTAFSTESLPLRKHASTWQTFLALLAAVTVLPFAVVPIVAHVVPDGSPVLYVYGFLIFLSTNFHV